MSIKVQSADEHKMVELKAKISSLGSIRRKLTILGAKRIGTFRQIDVYFKVPKGRLKFREVEGNNKAELIYYERENIAGPKEGNVFILKVEEAGVFKSILKRILKTSVIVEKVREIYQYQGTQIHLDRVKKLGNFVEFERKTPVGTHSIRKSIQILEKLMEELDVQPENLETPSYSDLIEMQKVESLRVKKL